MKSLLRGVGPALTPLWPSVVTVWVGRLIVALQLTLLGRSLASAPVQDSNHPAIEEAHPPA
ncbi:hypothetical protein [Mameliella alba]|uniref:hypothetical protein n=1 Tax=Mameliella alba TaxID=561184 RepID=UPI000B538707|nr:hypothetical protein [Mameliella alba]MBY6122475.1 hypothetical protein [Mameliella alba]OWV39572.1 hypothetical protein CDZ95_25575 [Mameliella alba]OWV54694.1 hypothetical protein CDZ97_24240 [Mameliella alba]